jgi:phosphoenolpyruvate-protein phosphotransferase (PTS system enzyme I)
LTGITAVPAVLTGIGVSPGTVVGLVMPMPDPIPEPPLQHLSADVTAEDAAELIAACAATVNGQLAKAAERTTGTSAEVLRATAAMALDPALVATAQALVRDTRTTPERAVWVAADRLITQLAALGGAMAERARDVADVRDRLVAVLIKRPAPGVPDLDHPFVLTALDLAPADTATIDPARVLAIVTAAGGPTSHTAILARALGIPAVVGVGDVATLVPGHRVLVDGARGQVHTSPTEQQIKHADSATIHRRFDGPGQTRDGHPVPLLANIGHPEHAQSARAAGAEGVGLFRTEFCFLDRDSAPSQEEQVRVYREVFAAFPGRRVVVRTLDAGADKPLPFLTGPDEPNPALGVRGLRTARRWPEVLEHQLTAIASASRAEQAEVWVMAPMVSTSAEADMFVQRCAGHGLTMAGVMIEVPAAALTAERVLSSAMFASIGTNDLIQYTLAADRQLADLGDLSSPWQPAVLKLIAATCDAGYTNGRPVSVCGEAAADPALAAVLVGLGVTTLSMSPHALADVAAVLREVDYDQCTALARLALAAPSAQEARRSVRDQLGFPTELGL